MCELCSELESLRKGVSADEVERAKAMCEAAVYTALEAPHIVAEDIGRQLITYARRVPLDEFRQKVQVCTCDSLMSVIVLGLRCAAACMSGFQLCEGVSPASAGMQPQSFVLNLFVTSWALGCAAVAVVGLLKRPSRALRVLVTEDTSQQLHARGVCRLRDSARQSRCALSASLLVVVRLDALLPVCCFQCRRCACW